MGFVMLRPCLCLSLVSTALAEPPALVLERAHYTRMAGEGAAAARPLLELLLQEMPRTSALRVETLLELAACHRAEGALLSARWWLHRSALEHPQVGAWSAVMRRETRDVTMALLAGRQTLSANELTALADRVRALRSALLLQDQVEPRRAAVVEALQRMSAPQNLALRPPATQDLALLSQMQAQAHAATVSEWGAELAFFGSRECTAVAEDVIAPLLRMKDRLSAALAGKQESEAVAELALIQDYAASLAALPPHLPEAQLATLMLRSLLPVPERLKQGAWPAALVLIDELDTLRVEHGLLFQLLVLPDLPCPEPMLSRYYAADTWQQQAELKLASKDAAGARYCLEQSAACGAQIAKATPWAAVVPNIEAQTKRQRRALDKLASGDTAAALLIIRQEDAEGEP